MIQVIGRSIPAAYPAPIRYYGEVRIMGRPHICTLPDVRPSAVIEAARQFMREM